MTKRASRTPSRIIAAAAMVILSIIGATWGAQPAAAAVCGSGVPGDVNGDGYAEVAVGTNANQKGEGVNVFYGHPSGLVVNAKGTARNDQLLTVKSLRDKGDAVTSFGRVTRFGDFNDDGCADLAVAGEDGVGVFYGSRLGLETISSQRFDLGLLYGFGPAFGRSLAVADLDGDGVDDLAVGVPLLPIGPKFSAGGVVVLWGSPDRINGSRLPTVVTADTPGIPGESIDSDYFGLDLAAGDFNGDDRSELVVTRSNQLFGEVQTLTYAGGTFTGQAPIDRSTPGVPGDPVSVDGFGDVLVSGDLNGDGRDDVAVGAPDAIREEGVGSVVLLYGSDSGLSGSGSQEVRQGVSGVPGTPDPDAHFAASLAIGQLDADPYADLAIGAYGDVASGRTRAGTVTLLHGSAAGVSASRAQLLSEATPGIPGKVDADEQFGCAVGLPHLQSKTQSTLVVGACGETVGKRRGAGVLYQLPIGAGGPNPSKASRISRSTAGVAGSAQSFYGFGGSISDAARD